MGCTASKQACLPESGPGADRHAWLQQYPSTDNPTAAAVPAKDHGRTPVAAVRAANQQLPQPGTSIQDLPPHLLANILSRQDNWVELFRCIPLVCKAWHQLALTATPHTLHFAFDVEQPHQPGKLTGLASLPGLQRLTTWRMLLLQQQRRRQQQQSIMQRQGSVGSSCSRSNSSSGPLPDKAPWAEWLKQHVNQAKEVSIVISAAGPGCTGQQHQLKDEALKALCSGSSSARSSTSSTNTSSTSTDVAVGAAFRSSSSSSCTGQLQLRALELQLPLFEHDVQMLAKHISSKAPRLERLTLVGYTSSTGSSSSSSSHQVPAPPAQQPPVPLPLPPPPPPPPPPTPPQQQQQQQPAQQAPQPGSGNQGGNAQGGTPNNTNADSNTANNSAGNRQREASQQIIRQGFITGACLQHLLAASSSLRRLTFARRQLYKTGWLAPATGLTHLALRDCQLQEQCLVELADLKFPALLHLDLSLNPGLGVQRSRAGSSTRGHSGSSSTCSSLELVCRKFTQLTALNISGWDLAPPEATASRASSSSSSFRISPWATFAPLAQLRQLADLKAEGCSITEWRSGPSSALQQLTSLSLSGNPLSSTGIAAVCSMQQLRRVELAGLTASGTAALGAGATAAAAAAAVYEQRVRLHAGGNNSSGSSSGDGGCSWEGLRGMSGLTELNLSGNCLCLPESSFGVFRRHFCPGLAEMSSLVKLDLSYCRFPYKLLRLLVSGLPAGVSDVVLDGCVNVTSGDLQVLALLPGLGRLSVSSMQPGLRDKHAEVLAGLASLRVLLLSGNDVGPKGLGVLLQGLSQLVMLDVSGNLRVKRGGAAYAATCNVRHCQVIV